MQKRTVARSPVISLSRMVARPPAHEMGRRVRGLYPVTQTRQGLHLVASAQNPLTSNVSCTTKPSDTRKCGHNYESGDIS